MVKLLAIDMDGTLLSDKKHIAEAQKKASMLEFMLFYVQGDL